MDPGRARYTGRSHDQGTATPTGRLPPGGPAGLWDRGGCSQIAVYIEDFKHWQEKRPHGHRQKPMRCLANALTWALLRVIPSGKSCASASYAGRLAERLEP